MTDVLKNRPVVLLVILAGLTAAMARFVPSTMPASIWIISAIGVAMGIIMVVWPGRSGFSAHPTGIRLAGIFVLGVWVYLFAPDLIHFVQGAQ